MPIESNIPKENSLLIWVQPLLQWGALLNTMGQKEALSSIWRDDRQVLAWIDKGYALLTHCQIDSTMAHSLVELIRNEGIDANEIERLLALQGWEYTLMIDDAYWEEEEGEYVPLIDSWRIAVGCATVLVRGQYQACNANTQWLNQGLGLFEISPEGNGGVPLVDATHLAWLKQMCQEHSWARQVIAQWLLDEPSRSPTLTWVFDEKLGQCPNEEFLDSVLQTLDERTMPHQKHHWEHTLREERLALLEQQAPVFFEKMQELHSMHLGLYGDVPQDIQASQDYCNERARLVANILTQAYAGNAESLEVSTNPSMGKLFCDDAPSMAL